jgi:hypothetical protein
MKTNDWQKRFGAARRELDRKLLAECERSLGEAPKVATRNEYRVSDELRANIARAFGRPTN